MTLIKKIAVIINWPRELDMYEEIIKILPKNIKASAKIRIMISKLAVDNIYKVGSIEYH